MAQIKIVVGCDSCSNRVEFAWLPLQDMSSRVDVAIMMRRRFGWGYRPDGHAVSELHCPAHRGDPSILYEGS